MEIFIQEEEPTQETKLITISHSQYSMWSTCPLWWKLRYVDKLGKDDGIEAVFGTAMHETIQTWLKLLYEEAPIKAKTFDLHEDLKERLKKLVPERLLSGEVPLTTKEEVTEFYIDGCNILDHIRKYAKDLFPNNGYELVGVELPLEKDIHNNLKFKGYLDVVVFHKAAKIYYIYDFKTSRWGWTYQKKDVKKIDQLLLYKKFYSEIYGIPQDNIVAKFIILKRKLPENRDFVVKHISGFEPSQGKPSMNKSTERFNNFISQAFNPDGSHRLDNIKATPSEKNCKYCPFKNNKELCKFSFYKKRG